MLSPVERRWSASCASLTLAQDEPPAFAPPCEGKVWWADSTAGREDFDFWVGEWQVFDRESGLLVGFDDVEKVFGGCAVRQHWRHMNDAYTLPGAPWRMQGGSHTTLVGEWKISPDAGYEKEIVFQANRIVLTHTGA